MVSVQCEKDCGWLERMKRGVRVGQLLQILPVVILVCVDPDTAPQAGNADSWQKVSERRGTENGKPNLLGWQRFRTIGQCPADGFVQGIGKHKIKPGVGKLDSFV